MATFADTHIGDQTQAPDMIRFVWTARIILVPALTAVDHQGGTKLGFLGASAAAHKPCPGISRCRTVMLHRVWSPWGYCGGPWMPLCAPANTVGYCRHRRVEAFRTCRLT
jgi:hypothetical protein